MVKIFYTVLPAGKASMTDGKDIWLSVDLDHVEERCAIMHETVHIENGHSRKQPEHIEMAVRYEVARRLLPVEVIAGRCRDSTTLRQIADGLGVTPRIVMDRAVTLTAAEAKAAGCLECQLCPAMKARYGALLLAG